MKEPIEYTIIALLIVLLLLSSYNILNMLAPMEFRPEIEAQTLMDKLVLTEGSPRNWDELLVLNLDSLGSFGLGSGDHSRLDRDKVNLLTFRYIGNLSHLIQNPFYVAPQNIQHLWVDLSERGFIIDFTPLINVTVSVDANGVRVNVFTPRGENKTSEAQVNLIIVSQVDATVYLSLIEGDGFTSIPDTSNIKCVVACVKLYSLVGIGYWVGGDDEYGFNVGGHLISPVFLERGVHRIVQVYYNDTSTLLINVSDYSLHYSNNAYVYNISIGNNASLLHNLDDNTVLLLAYDNSTGLSTIFFTYPATIWCPFGRLGLVNLRYGGIEVPSQASLSYRVLSIGMALYKVCLYVWRVER